MRNINILGIFILLLAFSFSSCEEEARPYNGFTKGSVPDGTVRIGILNQTIKMVAEDDDGNTPNYTTQLYVKMFGPPASSDVTVNFTIDPASVAKLGTQYTLSDTKFVIPAGSASGSIDITLINQELELDSLTPFKYTLTDATGYEIDPVINTTTVNLYKNCALDITAFDGNFEMSGDVTGVAKVENDPSVANGIIISGPIWYSTSDTLKLVINPDNGAVAGDDYFIYNGDAYGGLGRIRFEDINAGQVTNNCTPIFTFKATPTLPDSGYWWGGEFTFTFTRTSKKMTTEVNRSEPFTK